MLSAGQEYVGFNGNGRRRGCGYLFPTWLRKADYDPEQHRQFWDDLVAVAGRLGLILIGVRRNGRRLIWMWQCDIERTVRESSRLLGTLHLRLYTAADYLERWDGFFGWNRFEREKTADATALRTDLVVRLRERGVPRKQLAAAMGVAASTLSRYLHGSRTIPAGFAERALAWLEESAEHEGPPSTPRAGGTLSCTFDGAFLQGTYAEGPNWNNRLYKAACDMAARGISLDEASPALLRGAAPRSDTDFRQANATIQSAYSNERVASRF